MSGKHGRPRMLFLNHWARSLGGAEYSLIDILRTIDYRIHFCLVTAEYGDLCEQVKKTRARSLVLECSNNLLLIKRDRLLLGMMRQWRTMVGFLVFMLRLRKVVQRLEPCCIHANIPKSHMALFFLMITGYRGTGIIHMRELFPSGGVAYRCYRLFSRLRRLKIIAISEAVRAGLPEKLREKATVIYNGVHIPEYQKRSLVSAPVKFLYLGRIVPWKGCHFLIDMFSELRQRLSPGAAELRLVGPTIYWDIAYRHELEQRIRQLQLEETVSIGEKTDTPYELLSRYDVLCMPSANEPFGRVAVEAQSCGLPVIGFACGGLKEVIVNGKTGLLVSPGDGGAFTAAMASFVERPEMIAVMGTNGHYRAAEQFNRAIQVPAIITYLKEQSTRLPD